MPRTTNDPRNKRLLMRLTETEEKNLRKSAEVLGTTKTEIVLWGLRLAEAEIAKGQAPAQK